MTRFIFGDWGRHTHTQTHTHTHTHIHTHTHTPVLPSEASNLQGRMCVMRVNAVLSLRFITDTDK